MLVRIPKPYKVWVSEKAKLAGFADSQFANKKDAKQFVRRIREVDPNFTSILRVTFRYYDPSTGALYASRLEYDSGRN
jgi:hypothetical protein